MLNSVCAQRYWFVSCLCRHSLGDIEGDRVNFLLKDLFSGPCQLHLVCNQTNHSSWWSVIAFRLACLHITFFLPPVVLWTPAVNVRRGGTDRGLEMGLLSRWNHSFTASLHFSWLASNQMANSCTDKQSHLFCITRRTVACKDIQTPWKFSLFETYQRGIGVNGGGVQIHWAVLTFTSQFRIFSWIF